MHLRFTGPRAFISWNHCPASGAVVRARRVTNPPGVVQVEGPQAQRLLGGPLSSSPSSPGDGRGTVCLYYAAVRLTFLLLLCLCLHRCCLPVHETVCQCYVAVGFVYSL